MADVAVDDDVAILPLRQCLQGPREAVDLMCAEDGAEERDVRLHKRRSCGIIANILIQHPHHHHHHRRHALSPVKLDVGARERQQLV